MPNPALNEQFLRKAADADRAQRAGWAAPDASSAGAPPGTTWHPPVDDGPISPYQRATMTTNGVATATGVLLVVLIAAGVFGWMSTDAAPDGSIDLPGWAILTLFAALGVAIATVVRPMWARFTAPAYAVLEGLFLGAISKAYELQYDGIVVQAAGLTALTAGAMLFAYATGLLRVTERMRRIITVATMGIAFFYLASILLRVFSVDMPFIWDAGPFGIAFSVFVVGLAAFNLLLDFDLAEKGAQMGLPKQYEWYCAFGLLVTLVWLYLELLRLLSKLRER